MPITPYGLDLSDKLVALAHQRLPSHAHHLFIGNAWDWTPPRTFDYVRTELVYVPDELHHKFVAKLLEQYLGPNGKLLVAEYRSRDNIEPVLTRDRYLVDLGYAVEDTRVGHWNGIERTRVAIITKPAT